MCQRLCTVLYPHNLFTLGGQILRTKVLIENIHYVLLPEVIWKIFVTWYGNTGYSPLALPRTVCTACINNCFIEYNCIFRFARMEQWSFIQSPSRFIVTRLFLLLRSSQVFHGPSQPSSPVWDSWGQRLHNHLPLPPSWGPGLGGQHQMGDSQSYQDECSTTKLLLTNQQL